MTENDMEAFKRAYAEVPSQDNEGYTPDRGSFKCGFLAGLRHRDAELETVKRDRDSWEESEEACNRQYNKLLEVNAQLTKERDEWGRQFVRVRDAQLSLTIENGELTAMNQNQSDLLHQKNIRIAEAEARVKLLKDAMHWTMRELEIAEAESHQPMITLKPWIGGDPDRSRLDLAHLSACSFRAWGSVVKAIHMLKAQLGGATTEQDERREK